MKDHYRCFEDLRQGEEEGVDYRVTVTDRNAAVAVVAPHGGWIEPRTSQIATAIAGSDYSLYCFEGLRPRPHAELHITSTRFDEPVCLALLARTQTVLTVHGTATTWPLVEVGGLDMTRRDLVAAHLAQAGFPVDVREHGRNAGRSPDNICNRGTTRRGVQLEISDGLRKAYYRGERDPQPLADAVRRAIAAASGHRM